jgi:hypothetical protein
VQPEHPTVPSTRSPPSSPHLLGRLSSYSVERTLPTNDSSSNPLQPSPRGRQEQISDRNLCCVHLSPRERPFRIEGHMIGAFSFMTSKQKRPRIAPSSRCAPQGCAHGGTNAADLGTAFNQRVLGNATGISADMPGSVLNIEIFFNG